MDDESINIEEKTMLSGVRPSKFVKMALELESQNLEYKNKIKLLEDELSKYTRRVNMLEEKLKEVDPGLSCVGGSFSETNKASTFKVLYFILCCTYLYPLSIKVFYVQLWKKCRYYWEMKD